MNSKKRINLLILISIFLLNLDLILCQTIKPIRLGERIKGRMELDESHSFFVMEVKNVKEDSVLIFETIENMEEEIKKDEIFSDPDFYISKINKYPSSKQSSEWYSERYGTDILAIPSDALKEGDKLYIGMYCQFKCRYFFKTYFTKEIELELNTINYQNIQAHETLNYKLKIAKDKDFEELNVVAYSKNGGKFRIFMNKVHPSSQNTFNIIPSWTNGYSINVRKSNDYQYCTGCYYYIMIQNEGSETINNIVIYTTTYGNIVELPMNMPLYDILDKSAQRCYSLNITKKEKEEEKLIIQTALYSGDVMLSINGWAVPDKNNKLMGTNTDYQHRVITDNFVILTKKDFEKFDLQFPQNQGKDSTLYICLQSNPESSFVLSAYYLTQINKYQERQPFSILIPGTKVRNYLLKDQVISYELSGHNLEKISSGVKTNITINTFDVVGSTKSYIFFCQEEKCQMTKEKIEQNLKSNSNYLLRPLEKKDFEKSEIFIQNSNNECYKKPNITLGNGNVVNCKTFAIVMCETPNQDGLCTFDVQHTIQDDPILMMPKKLYYGSLPLGKIDSYNIVINDKNVRSIVVVLNSDSGDAELLLFKKTEEGKMESKEGRIVGVSFHNDYIPDVIRLTPEKLNREDVVGDYLVRVKPTTFSAYYLYYYVTYKDDKKEEDKEEPEKVPEVTLNIEMGQIITDYFPYDLRYKIYSFTPLMDQRKNIRIFIDRVNVDFNMYVYTDFSKFKILPFYAVKSQKEKEIISGYDWKDDFNNEVTILTSDEKFVPGRTLYIVISPNIPEMNNPDLLHGPPNEGRDDVKKSESYIEEKAAIQFYLGVTETEEEITITEGVPHTLSLDENYNEQTYFYEHTDINKDFELEINVFTGEIDIFIDMKEISLDDVKDLKGKDDDDVNIEGTMYYKLDVIDAYDSIVIPSEYFKKNLKIGDEQENTSTSFGLYFLIKRSKSAVEDNVDCKYTIIEFSSMDTEEILQPGLMRTSALAPGEKAYYVIEEVKKRKGTALTVTFKGGVGNVYVRIPEKPEVDMDFPSMENHDYIGESVFTSKVVEIPEEAFRKITSENYKLQILVTVEVYKSNKEPDPDDESKLIDSDVIYTISYANEAKQISQNEPYDGFVRKGEMQYFQFYFDDSAENIYFGLSNMNGDGDMYLNYGRSLPTPTSCDWKANEANHEYIDFNKDDPFFKNNKFDDVSGYYTLLITAFVDTSYTLFVSTHKDPVLPLRNNKPATCICEKEGEKCYLRYNEVFDSQNVRKGIKHNEIIFNNRFIYGAGKMYAKVVKDFELHGKDFYKYFPTETEYDMSNKESNQRDYMKMQIQGDKFSDDASILMTFICQAKTEVDITPTILRHYNTVDYIGENQENTFYIGYNEIEGEKPTLDLHFYNYENGQDIVYDIHSFEGSAHVEVYANDSRYDIDKEKIVYDYHKFREFEILAMNYSKQHVKNNENIDVYNPFSYDYHNFISVDDQKKHESINFKIIPKSEFGFTIKVNYDKNWNEIPLGVSQSYYARHHEYFGYFDLDNEMTDVDVSLTVEENLLISARLYLKINVIDITKKKIMKEGEKINEFSLYDYVYPTKKNFDYRARTDIILGQLSFNIQKLPKLTEEEKKTKFMRALIYVQLFPIGFEPIEEIHDDEEEIGRHKKRARDWQHWWGQPAEEIIDILVVAGGEKKTKYINALPYEYYLHNLTFSKGAMETKEKKIYTMKRADPSHDVLVVEISACRGKYRFSITDKLDKVDEVKGFKDMKHPFKPFDRIRYHAEDKNGKKIIYVDDLKSDVYYLTLTAVESDIFCHMFPGQKDTPIKCKNDLTYLIHYYTIKKRDLRFSTVKTYVLNAEPYGRGKFRIKLPAIVTRNIEKNTTDIHDYKFDVFVSQEESDFDRMGSVCVLCKANTSLTRINDIYKVSDVKIKNNQYLIVGGLGYRRSYYMNLLIQNTKNRELMTFSPEKVWTGGFLPVALWQLGLGHLVIVGLTIALIIVCRKYCSAKEELNVIKGDTLPKTESEINNNFSGDRVKYSGLGESY